MNKEKILKEEIKTLKDLDFKAVDLDFKNSQDNDFYFLSDDLKEILKDELQKHKIKYYDDLGHYFSLTCSQGDGYMFYGSFNWKNYSIQIKHNGHYYHSNTADIFITTLKGNEVKAEIEEKFKELYKGICNTLEKTGYLIIDTQNEEDILRAGFEEFKEKNNLNISYELFDLNYSTEEKENFVKICNSGNCHIKGLWIENLNLKVVDKIKVSCDITEFTEIILNEEV